MLIRLVKDWKNLNLLRQTPDNNGIWGDFKFVFNEIEECDFLIVLNRSITDISITCPSGHKWIIAMEPPNHFNKFYTRSYKYFDRIYSQHLKKFKNDHIFSHGAIPWQIDKTYNELINLATNKENKRNRVSCVVSNLNWKEG